MLVCLCLGVTDKEVKMTIRRGARSLTEVTQSCGAGGDCGSCHSMLRKMIDDGRRADGADAPSACLSPALAL